MVGSNLLFLYLCIVNIWAFWLMRTDKKRSKQRRKRRIRERTLLVLAIVGGGLGTWLAMRLFRHKTKHFSFQLIAPLSTLLWAIFILNLLYRGVIR
ncbi:DUF1294 domain-containing protein [Sulfoacidibacillus thermotolerans]|uniref:DUF1294 domain-containing protein n=1 Tax=Sulfoacidibacillus thermotolerans TaxID=1765684 RepID=A0A2U3DAS8_SULT2|nr:DUF1294 domain-containing protein [Sulfoacidibacillus thermotolerans]PWI58388.1 hypothetical protein BM613_04020 [Sulfoacidibacillus thermotolerans]